MASSSCTLLLPHIGLLDISYRSLRAHHSPFIPYRAQRRYYSLLRRGRNRPGGDDSAEPRDRLIAASCYLYPFLNGVHFGRFLLAQFTPLQLIILPLAPAIRLYRSSPLNPFLIFLIFYFAVVRNPSSFSRYVRFNAMQAIVLDVLLIFPDIIERLFAPRDGVGLDIVMSIDSTVFLFLLVSLIYGSTTCFIGRVPRLPIVADAADRQAQSPTRMAEKDSRIRPTTGAEDSQGDGGRCSGVDGGGGGGWGGWGFSSFSVFSDLQKAASAAAQEISRNAAAVVKRVTDIEIANEDSNSNASVHKEGIELDSDMEDEGNLLRKSALDKLERASEESLLGQGLKALDTSVESLASGAWLALGNALKDGSDLVHKLESNLVGTIQHSELPGKATALAPSIFETGRSFTTRGIQVLEKVGKETMELLISEAGLEVERSPKKLDQHVDEPFEEITFDRCFYIYGGPDHLEELEALSSHYALLFNRKKTKLAYEQKSFYDGKLKQILQIFSLDSDPEVSLDKGKNVVTTNDINSLEMKTLRDSSISKAADMASGFTAALAGIAANDMIQRTMDRLETIHSEGVHRLSEFCCFALSHLLLLGKSVISNVNKSKPQEDEDIKIDWPEDSVLKAKIIRSKAELIIVDIEAVSNSFFTGITDIMEAYQAAVKNSDQQQQQQNSSVQEKANAITALLKSGCSTALEKVQEALRFLTYVVLSTSMPPL